MKVRTGAKCPKVSYYVRLYGISVSSTPRSGTVTASAHRVQCSTTHCVHMHTLTMLPRSTDRVYHDAQRAQPECVNFSTYLLYSNPLCFNSCLCKCLRETHRFKWANLCDLFLRLITKLNKP